MKGVSAKDLRGNDPAELLSTARKLQEDLFKHRLKKNTNQLENTALLRSTRREIARVNTVLAERLRALGGTLGGTSASAKSAGTAAAPGSAEGAAESAPKASAKAKPATKSVEKSAKKKES